MSDDMLDSPGVRMTNDLRAFIPASQNIRPTRDRVLIEILPWKPSTVLEVVWHGEPIMGRVLAVGPGCHPKKYDGPKGKRTKAWDSKHFQPTTLKPGDLIDLGGLELRGYLHATFMWGHKRVLMCQEADVALEIIPDDATERVA